MVPKLDHLRDVSLNTVQAGQSPSHHTATMKDPTQEPKSYMQTAVYGNLVAKCLPTARAIMKLTWQWVECHIMSSCTRYAWLTIPWSLFSRAASSLCAPPKMSKTNGGNKTRGGWQRRTCLYQVTFMAAALSTAPPLGTKWARYNPAKGDVPTTSTYKSRP